MCSWVKRAVVAFATITGIIIAFAQSNVQVKLAIEIIMKEACNSYTVEFFAIIVSIDLIILFLLAKCLCHIYARKKNSLRKRYTARAVTENGMNA